MKQARPDPVRRTAQRQLQDFCRQYPSPDADPEGVHDLRVLTKTLRAYLRVYPKSCAQAVEQVDGALKALASVYTGQRDAAARFEALQSLAKNRRAERVWPCAHAALRQAGRMTETSHPDPITALEQAFRAWPDHHTTPQQIRQGAARVYEKARRTGKRAISEEDDDRYHRWRKWVKNWHYVARDLEPRRPPEAYLQSLQKLGALLGDYHDLCVLEGAAKSGDAGQAEDEIESLLRRIKRRKNRYRKKFPDSHQQLFAKPLYDEF